MTTPTITCPECLGLHASPKARRCQGCDGEGKVNPLAYALARADEAMLAMEHDTAVVCSRAKGATTCLSRERATHSEHGVRPAVLCNGCAARWHLAQAVALLTKPAGARPAA